MVLTSCVWSRILHASIAPLNERLTPRRENQLLSTALKIHFIRLACFVFITLAFLFTTIHGQLGWIYARYLYKWTKPLRFTSVNENECTNTTELKQSSSRTKSIKWSERENSRWYFERISVQRTLLGECMRYYGVREEIGSKQLITYKMFYSYYYSANSISITFDSA